MDILYTLFGTLIALGGLITFHELGHFWVARRCGVRVLRFSIGFGKPFFSWHDRHGTEFALAAIPLGGYVKMLDEREAPVPEHLLGEAFNRKPVRQRAAIVAAGPLANFLLAAAFFWILAMLGSQQARPVIGDILPDTPAARAGLQAGAEIIAVDGSATLGWTDVNLQLVRQLGSSGFLEIQTRDEGFGAEHSYRLPITDWLHDAEDPDPLQALGIQRWRPHIAPVISQLSPEGPAAQAGLQVGDRVLSFNRQPVADWFDLVSLIQAAPGQQVELELERAGQVLDLAVSLGQRPDDAGVEQGFLGAGVSAAEWPEHMLRQVSYGPFEGLWVGLEKTAAMSLMTLESLQKMLLGQLSVKNLSGPITIAKVAGASAESGLSSFLNFLAYLSVSLGVLNLLPVPVLDGGHLLFYAIEWLRGRPLSERVQTRGVQIGMALLLAVMLLALLNDIGRL